MRTVYLLLIRRPGRWWTARPCDPYLDRTLAVSAAECCRSDGLETLIVPIEVPA